MSLDLSHALGESLKASTHKPRGGITQVNTPPKNVIQPVAGPSSADSRPCRSCNDDVRSGANFCPECGTKLAGDELEDLRPLELDVVAANIELIQLDETGTEVGRAAVSREETTIGRGAADISFPEDVFLSPLHAQLNYRDGQLVLRDLGSRNGTWFFIEKPCRMQDGDRLLVGSQVITFRRLGYPGPNPPELDATRRLGSLTPSADIARLTQERADGSTRDSIHLSPGRNVVIGRDTGDWIFPYDPSMSGTHAEVRSVDADFVIADLGSRNGTAMAVRSEVHLGNASRFLVGDKLFRVEVK